MSEVAQNRNALPSWATEMISLYESRSVNQFILHGNVNDRFYLPLGNKASLGDIRDFLLRVLLPGFDLILSYDLGNGIRVEKGAEIFSQWAGAKESLEFPRQPRPAIEFLTRYFRYVANLTRLGKPALQVGCYVRACHLGRSGTARRAELRSQRSGPSLARLGDGRTPGPISARDLPDCR